ncbi:MAG: MASE1 domain-containing protein [Acidobacteriota bacterium]|nr:MASE1 domain-containing protein [Acidobacteriota bacterium]
MPVSTRTAVTGRLALIAIGVTAAYFIAADLGFEVAVLAEQVTTVWAPSGIAMAALLLWGRALWPAVWLGAFLANAGSSAPLWTAAVIATGNTLEAVAAAWLLRRDPAFDPRLRRLRDAARLIVLGAALATTISATIGVATLCLAALQPWDRFPSLWAAWWIGDALGVLVVAPAILTVTASVRGDAPRNWVPVVALVLGSAAITAIVFGQVFGATVGEGVLHYVVFPLVAVAAVRVGQPGTALVILAVSAGAIWHTVVGAGPFASPDLNRGLIRLQVFMAVLATTGLMLAAAISERLTGQRRRGAASGIGDVLAEARDLEEAAPAILRQVCENLEWPIGALWLVDAGEQRLRCCAVLSSAGVRGAPFERATSEMRFAPGVGLPGRVWASGRAAWIEDVVEDPNFLRAPVAREAGVHGAFGFPIKLGNEVEGVVEFFNYDVVAPDEDLLATLSTVGNQLGQFLGRKRVEREVIQEQRRTRAILDTALDAVIAMDHRGVITEFNPAAERVFGYRKQDALGRDLADLIIPPDLRAQHRAGLAKHLATGEGPFLNRRVETRGYHADGHEFPIEVAIINVPDEGAPRFTGFVRDLTDQKLAENAVRNSEERFRTLAASNSALRLYEQDHDLRYRWVFPLHPEFPDYLGKTDDELLPPGESGQLTSLKRRVLETGVGCRDEITVTLPTEQRSFDLTVQPLMDGSGAIAGVSGVAIDITERKRTEQLLRDSEARLLEASRHKDEFLAMLAHELRNPLAPIRTGLELVRLAGDTPDAVAQVRSMMERQLGYMVRLIDDLLDVSRISSGKIHLRRRPTPLAELVDGAVEANRAAIEAAGLELHMKLPETPVLLFVDPTRFVQVLSNLLNNATKFTDTGGRIVICGVVAPGGAGAAELNLSVSDTGIGISAEMLPRVFDLFTQEEQTPRRAQSGLGIGLALARRIVEMHEGHLIARSEGPGAGSEFTIRMPVLGPDVQLPAEPPARTERRAINRRVLVVDDNADGAEVLAALIRAMGGEVETAGNGLEAIRRAGTFGPDTIFLDIGMPGMDGYETCRRIRQEPFGRNVTLVALTGWGQERDKQRAAAAGFNVHFTKPVDPLKLRQLLGDPIASPGSAT